MIDPCPPVESLPDLALLPLGGADEDPRRRHLEACPCCQARLADYRDFMAGGGECPPAALAAAMSALDAGLEAAIAGTAGAAASDAAGAAAAVPPEMAPAPAPTRSPAPLRTRTPTLAPARGLLRVVAHPRLAHPLARAGFALAALFLLLVALDALPLHGPRREIHLRTGEQQPASTLRLEAPRLLPDGGLELSWQPWPGADAYRLRLLTPDLGLSSERACGAATRLRLTPAELAGLRAAGGLLVWQVEARRAGDPLAVSPPATHPLPERP